MTTLRLPDGDYPFADARFPLSKMAMMVAPADLEHLLRKAAEENGIKAARPHGPAAVIRRAASDSSAPACDHAETNWSLTGFDGPASFGASMCHEGLAGCAFAFGPPFALA